MSLRGRLALGGGVAAAVLGLALAVDPALVPGLSPNEALVVVLGAVALLYAGIPLHRRRATERRQAAGPDPETETALEPPGEEYDRLLAAAGSTNPHTANRRHRLRRQLLEAAVAAVRRREDCSAEAAREMLAGGTWTNDPLAASYFTRGPIEVADADLPLPLRVRLRLSPGTRRAVAARRVADEVAALTEPEAPR